MVYYLVFGLTMFIVSTLCAPPPSMSKRYRSDYQYNERTDAFYKLHIESRRGWNVQQVCEVEGASLLAPVTPDDISQAHGMFKQYPDLGEYLWISSDGRAHESVEEKAIINLTDPDEVEQSWPHSLYEIKGCDVMTRSGDIEGYQCFRQLPFICKVDAKNAPYDPHCNVLAHNYYYNATVGSCYNIPRRAVSWNEAYAECRAQGSHLVVLNSEAEKDVVRAFMERTPKVEGAQTWWFFFAGFRANKPVGNETSIFKTIFNETLSEAGFAVWSPGEPNNALNNEDCGTLFKNDGLLNDVNCEHEYAFICEKEVQT